MPRPRGLPTKARTYKVDGWTQGVIDGTAANRRMTKSAAVALLVQRALRESMDLRVGDSATLARADGAIEFRIALPGAARSWLGKFEELAVHVKGSLAKRGGLYEVK
jgi:hypothetical protein